MSVEDLMAALAKDPWHVSSEEFARLTPYQVRHVYFRPDPDKAHAGDAYAAQKAAFWKVWHEWRGLSEAETEAKWRDYVKGQGS